MNQRNVLFIILSVSLFLCSCQDKEKRYNVKCNISTDSFVSCHLEIFEYDDNDKQLSSWPSNKIRYAKYGDQEEFIASPKAKYLKIRMDLTLKETYTHGYMWFQKIFYLNDGNNTIELTDQYPRINNFEPNR